MLDYLLPPDLRRDFVSSGIDFSLEAPRLYPSIEGKALMVLGEMAGIRRAEEAILKQTIDASFLDFVPKHKGRSRTFALSGVFAGTATPTKISCPREGRKRKIPCNGNGYSPLRRRIRKQAGRKLDK